MPHQFFNSSRCGHVGMVIDPSAFKESVAVSGLVFPVWQNILAGVKGGALRAGSFFLTYGGRSLESNEPWLHRSRKPIVRAGVSGSEGCFQALPAPFQRPSD